jgi:geranylgeranyl diphosphate synthase type I
MLGVFGDTRATGKPSGSDLRKGKRTALVVDALRDPEASRQLTRVLGRSDASEDAVRLAVAAIDASGARARIEQRIQALTAAAREALARAELTAAGRDLLVCASSALTDRER